MQDEEEQKEQIYTQLSTIKGTICEITNKVSTTTLWKHLRFYLSTD